MKTIKTIFLTAMGISLLLLTGCSVTQSLPYDDVYSTGAPVPQQVATTHYTVPQSTKNNTYREGNVQVVNLGTNDTLQQASDTVQNPKEVVLIKNDTTPATTNIYNYYSGLNFDSPYFGTGTSGWALNSYWGSGLYGSWGYNPYSWNYPYYSWNYYYGWNYPYYSWNSWYWGSPYSWYNPYYGWNYPYYYGYYPGYYNTYGTFSNRRYGHRDTHYLGGNLPRGAVSGGTVPLSAMKSSSTRTRLSPPAESVVNGKAAAASTRMVKGSKSYQKALERTNFGRNEKRAVYQKPSGRSTGTPVNPNFKNSNANRGSNSSTPKYRLTTQEREMNARPRYQKPKQYQSLDNRNPRSSKEYFRPQPGNLVRTTTTNTKSGATRYNTPTRRFNVYRPSNMQRVNQRPVYRNTNNNSVRYQPSRSFSPSNNGTRIRTYSPQNSRTTRPNTYRPTNNSTRFSPSRTTTGTSGGSSGGSRTTTGGGGGSPHRR